MNVKDALYVSTEPWSVSDPFYQRSYAYQANGRELFYNLIHLSAHRSVLPVAYQFVKSHLKLSKTHFYPPRRALDNADPLVVFAE
ncbi:MAG: hypothetical protein HOC02_06020, partial [Methylococcales bacterium]|nr:hypothetical protein [Methylococcales bacterium]